MKDDSRRSNGHIRDYPKDQLPLLEVDAGLRSFNHCTRTSPYVVFDAHVAYRPAKAPLVAVFSSADIAPSRTMGDSVPCFPPGEGALFGS